MKTPPAPVAASLPTLTHTPTLTLLLSHALTLSLSLSQTPCGQRGASKSWQSVRASLRLISSPLQARVTRLAGLGKQETSVLAVYLLLRARKQRTRREGENERKRERERAPSSGTRDSSRDGEVAWQKQESECVSPSLFACVYSLRSSLSLSRRCSVISGCESCLELLLYLLQI